MLALIAWGAVAAFVAIVAIVLTCGTFVMIGDGYVAIIERLGTFNRILRPGLHVLYPLLERARHVSWHYYEEVGRDTRQTIFSGFRIPTMERIFDPPQTEAITKDRIKVFINTIVTYRIEDPKKAVYAIEDLYASMEALIDTGIRDAISHTTLDEAIEGANAIQKEICAQLKEIGSAWGVCVCQIRVQNLRTTDAIMSATEAAVQAEREAHARFIREKAEADANASQAESQRRIAEIEWETETMRTRAETERANAQREGLAQSEANALAVSVSAEADAADMRARAESGRIRQMIGAGVDPEYLTQMQRTAAFEAFARSAHRGDILVPYEYAKVFGGPVTLRKNV